MTPTRRDERSVGDVLDEVGATRGEVVAGKIDLGQAVEIEVHRLAPGGIEHAADPGVEFPAPGR